jgi:hypothetical protein
MQYLTGLLSCSSNSSFHPDQSEPISTKRLGSMPESTIICATAQEVFQITTQFRSSAILRLSRKYSIDRIAPSRETCDPYLYNAATVVW